MSPKLGRLGVYFEDRTVGEIIQTADETYSFHYGQKWLLSERSFPLSFALPLQEGEFDHKATLAFFENLLPEEGVREALAKQRRIETPFQSSAGATSGAKIRGKRGANGQGSLRSHQTLFPRDHTSERYRKLSALACI